MNVRELCRAPKFVAKYNWLKHAISLRTIILPMFHNNKDEQLETYNIYVENTDAQLLFAGAEM